MDEEDRLRGPQALLASPCLPAFFPCSQGFSVSSTSSSFLSSQPSASFLAHTCLYSCPRLGADGHAGASSVPARTLKPSASVYMTALFPAWFCFCLSRGSLCL